MTGASIELRFLGDVEVLRDGAAQRLPPSRKTRALLAYLVLREGAHRRDKLCDLLWDVADDPRGALRWSLSKIRRLIDERSVKRVVADRSEVRFEAHGASVDVLEVRAALAGGVEALDIARLEALSERCRGELLEGIELPEFGAFNGWCVAEREQARRDHAAILRALVEGLREAPARALPFAQQLVPLDPLDDAVRAHVIRLLGALGRLEEARAAHDAGVRLLQELRAEPSRRLAQAWREVAAAPIKGSSTIAAPILGIAVADVAEADASAGADAAAADSGADAEPAAGAEARADVEAGAGADTDTGGDVSAGAGEPAASAEASRPLPAPADPAAPQATLDLRALSETTPLVGRVREVTQLRTLLDEAEGGAQKVLMLRGEPGLGKSRLLMQIIGDARGRRFTVLSGCAYDMERNRPYGPWVDALRRLAQAHPALVNDSALALLLPELEQQGGEAVESSREQLFAAVVAVCRKLAPSPTLLVLDDVHWLDEASAELLHYFVRKTRDIPLALVLAARDGDLADNLPMLRLTRSMARWGMQNLDLAPLSAPDIGTLARGITGKVDAAKLHADSGGNPLFAIEIARALAGGLDKELPHTLRQVVRERLDRLPAEAADVLRWAAVLGRSFSIEHLEQLVALDLEAIVTALEDLERFAVLRADEDHPGEERYAFAHDVLHRAIYDELSGPRRRLMHLRAAKVLAAQAQAQTPAIAHAPTLISAEAAAAEAPSEAAERDEAHGARAAKAAGAANAAATANTVTLEPGAETDKGSDSNSDENLVQMARHATAAGDPALAARACLSAGRRFLAVFANREAYAQAQSGLAYAARLPEPERTRLSLELLEISIGARKPADVTATSARLIELAERALSSESLGHARLGFHMAALLNWDSGETRTAREQMMRAERAVRGGSDKQRLVSMAESARCLVLLERELGQAEAMLLEARAMEPQTDIEPPTTPDALGMLRRHQGKLDQAERLFQEALKRARDDGDYRNEHSVLSNLVELKLHDGRDEEALALAEQGLAIAERLREGSEAPSTRALVALCKLRLAWAARDDDAALAQRDGELDETLEELRNADAKHRLATVLIVAGELDLEREQVERARGRAEEALDAARRINRPTETALARVLLARAARAAGDIATERRQIDLFAAQPPTAASQPARAAVEALLAAGRPSKSPKERKRWRP